MIQNIVNFLSNGENIAFFLCAPLAIGGAIFMISFEKVVHMVLALACTFISLGALYVVLEAEFVAFVQVLIYAGAITILMIFGIMMTKHKGIEEEPKRPAHNVLAFVGCLALFGLIFYAIQNSESACFGRNLPGRAGQHDGDRQAVIRRPCHSLRADVRSAHGSLHWSHYCGEEGGGLTDGVQ